MLISDFLPSASELKIYSSLSPPPNSYKKQSFDKWINMITSVKWLLHFSMKTKGVMDTGEYMDR